MSVLLYFSKATSIRRAEQGRPPFNFAVSLQEKPKLIQYTHAFNEGAVPKEIQEHAFPEPKSTDDALSKPRAHPFNLFPCAFLASDLKNLRIVMDENGPCNQGKWEEWGVIGLCEPLRTPK